MIDTPPARTTAGRRILGFIAAVAIVALIVGGFTAYYVFVFHLSVRVMRVSFIVPAMLVAGFLVLRTMLISRDSDRSTFMPKVWLAVLGLLTALLLEQLRELIQVRI